MILLKREEIKEEIKLIENTKNYYISENGNIYIANYKNNL